MKKLFLVPVTFSAVIAFVWPLVSNFINIPFPEKNVIRFVYLFILYMVFVTGLLLSEPRMVMNNFRYLQKKLMLDK